MEIRQAVIDDLSAILKIYERKWKSNTVGWRISRERIA